MAITKIKLYNGKTEIFFDSLRHKYTLDGMDEIPSVTKILGVIAKPQLINWASNMAVDHISEAVAPGVAYDEIQLDTIFTTARKAHWQKKVDAGNIGSFVHKWVENYIKGTQQPLPINPMLKASVEKFLSWVDQHDVKFLLSEQICYSKKHQYVGTLDFVCKIDGKMYLGDLKTSSGIYDEYKMQVSAYRLARTEEYPKEKYAGALIVRISRDGDFEFFINNDDSWYETMSTAFINALHLHRSLESIKKLK